MWTDNPIKKWYLARHSPVPSQQHSMFSVTQNRYGLSKTSRTPHNRWYLSRQQHFKETCVLTLQETRSLPRHPSTAR